MKKILLLVSLAVVMISCKKEEIKPQTQEPIGTQQEQLLEIKINK